MELFENEIHYTHCLGEQLHKNLSEVLLLEDLEAYLRAAYPDITQGEIGRTILTLKTPLSGSLYDENRRVFGMIVDGFPLRRDVDFSGGCRDAINRVSAKEPLWIRLIDFDHPENNDFKIVNQKEKGLVVDYLGIKKRMNLAFKMCSSSDLISKKERSLILFFTCQGRSRR